jgi:hypothetical protein
MDKGKSDCKLQAMAQRIECRKLLSAKALEQGMLLIAGGGTVQISRL